MGRALLVLGTQNNTHTEGELTSTSAREDDIPKIPFCVAGGMFCFSPHTGSCPAAMRCFQFQSARDSHSPQAEEHVTKLWLS